MIATALFIAGASTAAVSDVAHRRVPNRLNLAILAMGLMWRATAFGGWEGVPAALAGVGVGLALLIVPFAAGWVGAGDVKLLAALGAWLGPSAAGLTGLCGLAGGGLLAAAIAVRSGAAVRTEVVHNVTASVMTLTAPVAPRRATHQVVPLAVPLAAAAVGVFLAAVGGLP